MFDVTNFTIVLVICNIHVVIFIKKNYLVCLFRIIFFCEFLKILWIIILKMLKNYALSIFFKWLIKKYKKNITSSVWQKTLNMTVLDLWLLNYLVSLLKEKKITRVLTFKDFSKKPNFLEDDVFHQFFFSLSNFRQDIGVCFVNAMI